MVPDSQRDPMPSRHRRPPRRWPGWKWPALIVGVLVVGLAAAATVRWTGQQNVAERRDVAVGQHSASPGAPRKSTMTLPPAAPGSSAAPRRTAPATPTCPASTGAATVTVGPGGRYSTIQSAINAAGAGDTIEIAGGTYHEAVTLTRSGSPGAYLTLRAKAGAVVTIDGRNTLPTSSQGLLTIDGARYIRISGLVIVNSHEHGIYAGHTSHVIISNSKVSHTQDGGIFVGDGSSAVLTCNSVDHANAAASGGDTGAAANEAISLFNVAGFEVKDNTVFDSYEEGIDLKNGTNSGTVRNNQTFRNVGPNIYLDGASDVKISANRVYGATGSSKAGIVLGVESGGSSQNVQIYNNVIHDNAGGGIDMWIGHYSGVQIFYNTIYANGRAAIRANAGVVSDSVARDNIAYDNPLTSVPGVTLSGNLTIDPEFVNLATGDVRLGPRSPALNHGSAATAPATDFAGNRRPIGSAPDLGAYESG